MRMRWSLLIVVFLCVAARLARCQDTAWLRIPENYWENDHMSKYDLARADQKDYWGDHWNRDSIGSGDPQFYNRVVNYRSNRAIDVSRSSEVNTKMNQQPSQSTNLPKPSTKFTIRPRRLKNVTIADGVCQSIDIRNNVQYFPVMKGCRVIEGYLQVVLIENSSEAEFQDIQFPELREVTGYVLLYRVNGLKSLANLFPNLEVIRGNILLTDYAFMVYEMQNLQEIGLKKLMEISRGSVRIEKNPTLCYTHNLNWDLIVSAGANVIKDNREESSCPGCSHCPQGLCWTAQHCQSLEKPKCHEQCLGECRGPTDSDCYVCKHYRHEGKCVEKCPSHLYAYLSRRCITTDECVKMNSRLRRIFVLEEGQAWRPFNGSCLIRCPEGYEDALDQNNMTTCRVCESQCRKVNHGALIRHISDAQMYRGTTVVRGALEFQIRNGNPNIMNELTEAFGQIEEITEYLKITHSFPITSLSFFKKLKVIRGEKLDINNASLVVLDNPNLSDLFPLEQNIQIENGRLFFHYNPKLCLSKILELSKMVNITNFTDMEVQPESNGEKVACNVVNINITVRDLGSDYADLVWDSYQPTPGQQLLSYLLNYMETENENISYESNACGGNNAWQILDVDIPKWKNTVSKHITNLKPYTMYAVFVKTFNARNTNNFVKNEVGQSEIIFFRTKSTIPSPPVNVVCSVNSESEILVTWKPPIFPNGPIGYYMISSSMISEESLVAHRDYCNNPLQNEVEETVPEVSIKTPIMNSASCCSKDNQHVIISKKFEIFCHENTTISYISPGWRDYCVYNSYNSVDDKFYELSSSLQEKENSQKPDNSNTVVDASTVTYNVSGANNSFVIKNLRHFTRYSISIAACGIKVNDSHMCSSIQYTTARTKKLDHADDVLNVKVYVTNNTIVEVIWDLIKNPNAMTVTYTIQYTNLDIKDAKKITECIPNIGQKEKLNRFFIKNRSPGRYSLRMRSTSLAGDSPFSDVVHFSINVSNTAPITMISLLTVATFSVISITIFVLLRIQHKKKKQERLIAIVNPDYIETKYVIDDWEVPAESVEIVEKLGLGNFGMVYQGVYDKTTPVAIKTISKTASQREKNEFLNEASVMKNFSTYHIIKLLGVVSIENPPYVIMELMENGDLKTYLRKIRDRPDLVPDACGIMRMAAEIADGMAYLESKKYVHRDLAARNCMVSKDLVCKIGDFGMARDIYETDYYKIGRKGLLPIRWMAPENLSDGMFTSDSDVWSFGVVLYEILTLAEMPYQGFSNEEVLSHVLHKGTLNIPRNCPENIHKIMEKCFKWRPSDRPTFMEIVGELEPCLRQDFCENSFYHSAEGVESRKSGLKKPYHPAAPIRFHWGNETARWVKEFEDNVTLLDQTKAGTSRGRIFKNGFQHFGNVTNLENVPLER
ncbi:insulin receptor isoform X1 [Megalopta genalis]|uniref:insulin receptor isoform X1 n=1 Tax=Megalopta genalis TaxID=115081 RepID=UPI001442FB59|nr:insulin receptor-like isoform X1 [Megalopta genalis]XP_033332193.1 insulin receptor-like isoform X1 [Megalopta genalis]XP_033332194.1 insulin receptor-like isoform X1 [Megalopta genalis]XP_033332195.1 insulin receptor-like isoform X1 [Megalopta genalis]XP_033332196.1 insulin receptor-like isoform X1 [Megalopta genalis]XP_033332197.1 insulin receptor-like isoform X1 [Megalopta genalis]